eukprot:scaffold61598_cov63-Phaeocystis_antarctica.AAC.5
MQVLMTPCFHVSACHCQPPGEVNESHPEFSAPEHLSLCSSQMACMKSRAELSGLKSSAPRRASFCRQWRVVGDWMSQMARRTCSAVDKLTSAVG